MTDQNQYQPKINFSDRGTVLGVSDKVTQTGKRVVTLWLALYEGKKEDGTYKPSTMLDIVCWDDLAEFAGQLQKKHRVAVTGRLTSNHWLDKDGKKQSKMFVNAASIEYIENSRA